MNGKAEEKNKPLFELVVAIYWIQEMRHFRGVKLFKLCVMFLKNPKSKNTTSPYEVFKNNKPNLSYFKT